MKNYLFLLLSLFCINAYSQKNSGIFYSTLFTKEGVYLRNDDFGNNADYVFFCDVNGDALDDGVAYYPSQKSGNLSVALSDGVKLISPTKWADLNLSDFWKMFLGDINGDKMSDVICIDQRTSDVWVMLSDGNSFSLPLLYNRLVKIENANNIIVQDLDDNGSEDICWSVIDNDKQNWFVSYSENNTLKNPYFLGITDKYIQYLIGDTDNDKKLELIGVDSCKVDILSISDFSILYSFNIDDRFDAFNDKFFLEDIDGDGYEDMVVWAKSKNCDWYVHYSLKNRSNGFVKWINQHLPGQAKNATNNPDYAFLGSIDGEKSTAMIVSNGRWLGVNYTNKEEIIDPGLLDRYEVWGNDYIPVGGTYDPGNQDINDRQIRMIHDAGFTYITLDITNGSHDWVDWRAKALMDRVRVWNNNLKPGQHKMYINIALGMTRGKKSFESFIEKLSSECKRAWEEFYIPYKELYYHLNGKPLLIHMIDKKGLDFINRIESYSGNRKYIDRFCNRWMDGNQEGTKGKPNMYGWIVPGEDGNEYHEEMMPVMPGFWNGITFWGRNNGMQYKKQWLRVLKKQPASVWVNSFNETWEHTSVEPSRFISGVSAAHIALQPWTDAYGNYYDSYYWDLTFQYNQLYMNNVLYNGNYIHKINSDIIYKISNGHFLPQTILPIMKPVLLVPKGFINEFDGGFN